MNTFDDIVKETVAVTGKTVDVPSQHHFDTYNIVQDLQTQGFSKEQAVVIMKGMKFKLRESVAQLHQELLLKSALENESYLFSAAVSELRTEIQMMRQKDTQALKAETFSVTREVEALAQHIREDVDLIKNEIALDMDNRKNETRSDQKEIDMTIQELNSKFTVKLGEVRTGLESTRWETIWKGLAGVAASSLAIATIAYFLTNFAEKRDQEQRAQKLKRKKQMQEDARSAGLVDMDAVY
ncbi:uncharacterized protein EV154DRAFT_427214 [Mucor mucedo]|uniref:uncharacterized protein n=1 Tax=Mucor mucedo TaxID=29922 RepID=UPI00221F6E03|nr:uncharacterized protein EV154DRAFT_427214 [Mucor mucedo]KAI7887266.1 hypothetical protein EV154DRAFT_427214 [Mucor mucedo]